MAQWGDSPPFVKNETQVLSQSAELREQFSAYVFRGCGSGGCGWSGGRVRRGGGALLPLRWEALLR
jgi:hypothetical protein